MYPNGYMNTAMTFKRFPKTVFGGGIFTIFQVFFGIAILKLPLPWVKINSYDDVLELNLITSF